MTEEEVEVLLAENKELAALLAQALARIGELEARVQELEQALTKAKSEPPCFVKPSTPKPKDKAHTGVARQAPTYDYHEGVLPLGLARTLLKWPFAGLFIGSGILHFAKPDIYLRLMPPYIPYPSELVAISGVVEGVLGLLLLVPRTQRAAAWGLIATLVAIFPANIYGAVTAGTSNPAMPGVSVELAWLRLPIQPLLIVWAYWYTRQTPPIPQV